MPIYEFDCAACGERFEALVPVGTESQVCASCGAADTVRVMSAPGAAMKFVKSPGTARRQESKNAKLHTDAKADFKRKRKQVGEARAKARGRKPPA